MGELENLNLSEADLAMEIMLEEHHPDGFPGLGDGPGITLAFDESTGELESEGTVEDMTKPMEESEDDISEKE